MFDRVLNTPTCIAVWMHARKQISSLPEVFCKIDVLKSFPKFTEKHQWYEREKRVNSDQRAMFLLFLLVESAIFILQLICSCAEVSFLVLI